MVTVIEESKNLSDYTFDELMGSLLAHEVRLYRSYEKVEEKKIPGERGVFLLQIKILKFS